MAYDIKDQHMTLDGKRIVLVGGTSGIGLATARLAADDGAAVVVASSRRERVDAALAQLPDTAEGQVVDASDEDRLREFFDGLGAFDHLVYTAGETLTLGEIGATSLESARQALDVRVWGAYATVKHAHRSLRPGGSIVLSSGIAGARPQKGWTVAAGICGAMEALTRALAAELAPIRVNAVAAGLVRTELWRDMPEADREAMYETTGEALPAGRVGEPTDIAQAHLFLMRDGFSTGSVVVVDGGAVLV